MRRIAGALLCGVALQAAPAQEVPFTSSWRLSGYYLTLLTRSTTLIPTAERYALDLNRLRLKLDARVARTVRLDVQYDNELLWGSYLRTGQFALLRDPVPDQSLDLEHTHASGRSLLARHRLYRASATWSSGANDITVGRQRIAWGNGLFWSPLDLLNPFDATRIERDERDGIDALLVSRQLASLAHWNAVVAPSTPRSPPVVAAYVHWNAGGADYSLAGGRVRGADFVGADFSSRLGGLGIRAEASASRRNAARDVRALIGADYGFANTLTLSGELYFNGAGAGHPDDYDIEGLLEGRVRSLARRYGALAMTYDLTPLLKVLAYGVVNFDDRSAVFWPGLEYSLSRTWSLSGGMQAFSGKPASEYGRFHNVVHLQAKAFF